MHCEINLSNIFLLYTISRKIVLYWLSLNLTRLIFYHHIFIHLSLHVRYRRIVGNFIFFFDHVFFARFTEIFDYDNKHNIIVS